VPFETLLYAEVYAIKAMNPEVPDRRWPHLELRLQPRNLVQFGMATIKILRGQGGLTGEERRAPA